MAIMCANSMRMLRAVGQAEQPLARFKLGSEGRSVSDTRPSTNDITTHKVFIMQRH